MNPIHVILADDHALFREGIRIILETCEGVKVVAEAAHGKELMVRLAEHPTDVVLLDLQMPEMDGLEAVEVLLKDYPDLKIIVLSMVDEDRMVAHLMERGVHGYLLKDCRAEELCEAIKAVMDRGYYFNERTSKAMLSAMQSKSRKPPTLAFGQSLSRREKEVLLLICQELTTNEIGEKLFISPRTVEGHRKSLVEKFGVRNIAGLVLKAYKDGWLED